MSVFKVGDKVRILHTDYIEAGLDVGTIHEVAALRGDGVDLNSSEGGGLYFRDDELESDAPTDPQDQTQYIRILEAIAGTKAVEMARNITEALRDAS